MSGQTGLHQAFRESLPPRILCSDTSWDVICVGQTSFDTVHLDKGISSKRVGGSAYIPANLMANLGLRTGLVSCWGTPHTQDKFAAPTLDLAGVVRRPERAIQITLKYEKQQLCGLKISDPISKFLSEPQIPRSYYRAKFFHLTPAPAKLLCDVAARATNKGIRVVFTPKEDFPSLDKSRVMQRLLRMCFMCFLNERELKLLTGTTGAEGISMLHSAGVENVAVTLGWRGAVLATRSVSWKVKPSVISKREDVVGAGDCFAAGILAALCRGGDLYEASQFANKLTNQWLLGRGENRTKVVGKFASKLDFWEAEP